MKRNKGEKPEALNRTESEQSKLVELGAAAAANSRTRAPCCVTDATGRNTPPFMEQVAIEGEVKEGRDAIEMKRMGAEASAVSERANVLLCWPAAGGVTDTLAVMPDSDGAAALHASTEVLDSPRVGLVMSVVMLTTLEPDAVSN